jgi:hypothetical protein
MIKKIKDSGKQCEMHVLINNTTNNNYGSFTDKILLIQKDDQIIILEPKDLRQFEKTLGCKFKIK